MELKSTGTETGGTETRTEGRGGYGNWSTTLVKNVGSFDI